MERILILDDDPGNLHGIADVLRSEQYCVLEASTDLKALEMGKTCGFMSLFVTDMDLPSSSGTVIALKLVALFPNLPVLFISGTPRVWWTSRERVQLQAVSADQCRFYREAFLRVPVANQGSEPD